MAKKFLLPLEMKKTEKRNPLSTRVKKSTWEYLKKVSEENDISLGELTSNIIDQYVIWLRDQPRKKIKRTV